MKTKHIIRLALLSLLTLGAVSCAEKAFEEVTELQLSRCLQPQNLSATLNEALGDEVTFDLDAARDVEQYNLVVYSDEAMTVEALNVLLAPSEFPYTVKLPVDQTYWYKIQALHSKKDPSDWVNGPRSFKTVAVKGNLFLKVSGKTSTSVTLSWNTEADDADELTVIRYGAPSEDSDEYAMYTLQPADIAAGSATISDLAAGKEYVMTLYYYSASRGQVNVRTLPDMTGTVAVSTLDDLKASLVSGGKISLSMAGSPYDVGEIKPTGDLEVYGEAAADGSRPVIKGKFLIDATFAGSSILFEEVSFDGAGVSDRIFTHSSTDAKDLTGIVLRGCEIKNYTAGLFYGNGSGLMTVGEILVENCDIHDNPGGDGDFFDVRKNTTVPAVTFRNNTIYDGIRTFIRIDDAATITLGTFTLEGNTFKHVSTVNNSNNRGIFGVRNANYSVSMSKNLFLLEEDDAENPEKTRAHLFQNDAKAHEPKEINASDNYFYKVGKDYFTKVAMDKVGGTLLTADPCVNALSNIFNLTNNTLKNKQVGASRWWTAYVEEPEDLTLPLTAAPHTWDFSDTRIFNGDAKKEMVRDGLHIHASEALPVNLDGGINFTAASQRSGSGYPMDGYVAFKVNAPGTVYIKVADPGKLGGSVLISTVSTAGGNPALQAAVAANPSLTAPQKVMLSDISEETLVMFCATEAIGIEALSWTTDMTPVNTALQTPAVTIDVEKVTEGDETVITAAWEAIPNAASYNVSFKGSTTSVTETSFIIEAATTAALKAGSYKVEVVAVPAEGDIYNSKSSAGVAAFAVLSKGGEGGGEQVPVTISADFSSDAWQTAFGTWTGAVSGSDCTNPFTATVGEFSVVINKTGEKNRFGANYIQFGGKGNQVEEGVRSGNRVIKFTAPAAGTLKVTTSTTGNTADLTRTVAIMVNGGEPVSKDGAGVAANAEHAVLEFDVDAAGEVLIFPNTNGLRFYSVEFTYMTGGAAAPEEHFSWDFSDTAWQTAFGTWTGAVSGSDCNNPFETTVDGLTITINKTGEKNRFGKEYIQFGGKGNQVEEGVRSGNRVFKFSCKTAGTLKVTTSTTGNTADLTRDVSVIVNDGEPQSKTGAGVAADAEHAVLEFEIEAGNVVIFPNVNGLRFYKIQFDTK